MRPPITVDVVVNVTAEVLGVWRDEIVSSSRKRHLVNARYVAAHVAKKHVIASGPEIARSIGYKSHASIYCEFGRGCRDGFAPMVFMGEETTLAELAHKVERVLLRDYRSPKVAE